MVKNPLAHAGDARDAGSIPGLETFLGLGNQLAPVFLLGKSHGQRCLPCCSPWGHKEPDLPW